MRDLILVPIEPLNERYSEQWYRRLPVAFEEAGFNVTVIDGQPLIEDDIKVGAFLDVNSTVHYKMTQLQEIARMFNCGEIKPDTVFFFSDIEFWGLESVRLMADMNKVPVKITGFLHAASYTQEDAFSIASSYQRFTELGWIAALDLVFVGSHYSQDALVTRRFSSLEPRDRRTMIDKIRPTGNPLFLDEYPGVTSEKENLVLLSNRFDSEKRPDETLALFQCAKAKHPDWRFVVCTGRKTLRSNDESLVDQARKLESLGVVEIHDGLTKAEYHALLAKAKVMVSHSIEESYGYCIAEALVYQCAPLLRTCASHPEMVAHKQPHLFPYMGPISAQLTKLENLMSDQGQEDFRSWQLRQVLYLGNGLNRIIEELVKL